MFRSVAFALSLLLSLAFIGCGGGTPGTGTDGNNGGGGNTGTGMREVRVDSPACAVQPEPNACAYEVADRTQSENPIMEFNVLAVDCSPGANQLVPISGAEHTYNMLEDLQQITTLRVPNRGNIMIFGKLTFTDSSGEHEWRGGINCRDIATIDPQSRLPLLLGQVR